MNEQSGYFLGVDLSVEWYLCFILLWDAYHGCRLEVVNARVSLLSPVH